ncbi:MAG TPA: hypothetical protein VIF57_17465 [Polyangia bacterium]
MRRAPSLLCGALVLFVWSRTSPAAAPDARRAARQIDLIVAAPANEMQQLEPPIRDMLAAKGLDVATTRKRTVTTEDVAAAIAPSQETTTTTAPPTVARVLLDFTVAGQATLLLIDPRRGRVFARRMTLANGLDAVARARVRFIIEQSVDAILEGRDIGVSREEFQRGVAPPPAPVAPPPPAAPAPAPAPRQLLLAGGYELVAMGSGEYQHAATLVVGARFTRLQLAGAARLAAPLSIAGDGAQARLSTGGVSASAAARVLGLGDVSVFAGLGAGLDVTRVEPTVTAPDLQPAAAFWARGPSLKAFAALERLFGRIAVAVVVGAEAHLLAERYTVRTASETRDVFVPRRVRPTAALLVGVVF